MQIRSEVNVKNPRRVVNIRGAFAAALALSCGAVHAEVQYVPHLTTTYEYNSNMFLIPDDGQPRLDPDGEPRVDDYTMSYGGGINLNGNWGENNVAVGTNIQKTTYGHFNQLDRIDRLLSLAWNWTATRKISGIVTGRYDEHLTPFTELVPDPNNTAVNAASFTQIDRMAGLTVNYQLNRTWQISTEGTYTRVTVPWVGQGRTYDLQALYGRLGLRFTGKSKISWGVSIDGNDGIYIDAENAPEFSSVHYQATVDYVIGPRSVLNLNYGYTTYRQDQLDSSANVGGVSFNHQLTDKITYYLRYDRTLAYFPNTQGSQLGTSVSGGMNYQLFTKVGLAASYGETKAQVEGNLIVGGDPVPAHEEKMKATQVTLNYGMLRWLNISPYYRYQERTSDEHIYDFDGYVWGVNLGVQFE